MLNMIFANASSMFIIELLMEHKFRCMNFIKICLAKGLDVVYHGISDVVCGVLKASSPLEAT